MRNLIGTLSWPAKYDLDMAIVIRKLGGKWEKTEKVIFADEAQLQRLLYESPELIPTKVEDQAAEIGRAHV